MAGVRDPAFWKRFSYAVHLDEENSQRPDLKHSESWLARQQSKKNRRTRICWLFWILFFVLIAGAVIAVIVLLNSGLLSGFGKDPDLESENPHGAGGSGNATMSAMPSASASAAALGAGLASGR